MRSYLREYWRAWLGPMRHNIANDGVWLVKALTGEVVALRYPWPALYTAISALGAVALWRRRRTLSLVLFLPAVVTLAAADLHLYPFSNRLVLFLVPAFLLAVAEGVEALSSVWRNAGSRVGAIGIRASLYLAARMPFSATTWPPKEIFSLSRSAASPLLPTAITMRPQFASLPAIAVLTKGELAMDSAMRFAALSLSAPETSMRISF